MYLRVESSISQNVPAVGGKAVFRGTILSTLDEKEAELLGLTSYRFPDNESLRGRGQLPPLFLSFIGFLELTVSIALRFLRKEF